MRRILLRVVALVALGALAALPAGAEGAYYGSRPAADIFQVQTSRHTCTLIACTMMLRCYSSLMGDPYIQVTETGVGRYAWIQGVGLSHSFTIGSVTVAMSPEISGRKDKRSYLIEILAAHPEGVVIYDAGAPHAIWLYGYDEDTDTFYCADTFGERGGHGITLAESSLRGADQAAKIRTIDRIWYVQRPSEAL